MALKATRALYTDTNPMADDWKGQVLQEGDANANFVLVGAGGVISDDNAKKFGLKAGDGLEEYDKAKDDEAREAAAKATYASNNSGVVAEPALSPVTSQTPSPNEAPVITQEAATEANNAPVAAPDATDNPQPIETAEQAETRRGRPRNA